MSFLLRTCKTARIFNKYVINNLHTSAYLMMLPNQQQPQSTEQKPVEEIKKKPINIAHAYKPDNLEKKFLVWTKKYKSVEEVPDMVSREEMERSRSQVRIRLSNYLMALTLLGCVYMVYSGKKAAEKGETVQQMNLDWHKNYNAETPQPKN